MRTLTCLKTSRKSSGSLRKSSDAKPRRLPPPRVYIRGGSLQGVPGGKTSGRLDLKAYLGRLLQASAGANDADLHALSPVRLSWQPGAADTLAVLRHLYQPDEHLFIGTRYDRLVATAAEWTTRIESLSGRWPHGWPHIAPNPMDGQLHRTLSGTLAYRCDAAVCAFRFAVVEFDGLPREQQTAFWHSIIVGNLLNVAVLVDSGGKSIHGWVRVDCPDREAWERDVELDLFKRWLVPMGVDGACRNESRLSRLPGCMRMGGGMQRLMYLKPPERAG